MTILIAEDSRFMRHAMERMLTKEGYKVLIAEDGEQALRVAQETLPELILLDMMLPKLSGLEVLEALKRLSSTQQIPVIVLTSLSEKNESKLLQAGAAAYLVKSDKLLEDNARTLRQLIQTLRPSCCDMLEFSLFFEHIRTAIYGDHSGRSVAFELQLFWEKE